MRTIAITGVEGLIGRALWSSLSDPTEPAKAVRLIGLDRLPMSSMLSGDAGPASSTASADAAKASAGVPLRESRVVDIRDPGLVDSLHDVDVLVHLAFQMDPIRDLDKMRSINVDGTRNVFEAARVAGVRRVVYVSSVVAYGARADNDLPLTEQSPLRADDAFPYAAHKREVEAWLWPWHAAGDGPAVTVLRSAAVLGPGVQNFLTRILEVPRLPVIAGATPPLQFVHLDDLVGALVHAIRQDLDGVFNVAADGWLGHEQVVRLIGRGTLELDAERARRLVARATRLGVGELPSGIVDLFVHPWVMSNARLRATGWEPTRSNEEALLEAVLEHASHVTVGRIRVARRTLRASGVLAVAGGLAATFLRRRTRSRA